MRQIKASEVKPGMVVAAPVTRTVTVSENVSGGESWRALSDATGFVTYVDEEASVTVLSEPQPEEPTEFGAKVRVRKGRFVRLVEGDSGFRVWFEEGTESWWTWDDLCEMGPVTVVPDQGWTVPAGTPEVPERIEDGPRTTRRYGSIGGGAIRVISGCGTHLMASGTA